ncbi:MAG: hypothetical protein ACYTGZ_21330, partial [Planctomycetota bacterium]
MRATRLPLLWLLLLCTALFGTAASAGPEVRGQRSLSKAIASAVGDDRGAIVIVDATPYIRARIVEIGIALQDLDRAGRFRIAALGEAPSRIEAAPGALTPHLKGLLAKTRRPTSTIRALRKTLAQVREPGAVVYLADWHFEDDAALEPFLSQLKARKQRLSVIGSEAAFGRGWLDGFTWFGEEEDIDRIGKNPWRP